jgi:hypothetical protein
MQQSTFLRPHQDLDIFVGCATATRPAKIVASNAGGVVVKGAKAVSVMAPAVSGPPFVQKQLSPSCCVGGGGRRCLKAAQTDEAK